MSATNRTQDKSVKPEGIEDKALAPAVEDKAVAPTPNFKLSAHLGAGNVDDEDHAPGDEITGPREQLLQFEQAGYGKRL